MVTRGRARLGQAAPKPTRLPRPRAAVIAVLLAAAALLAPALLGTQSAQAAGTETARTVSVPAIGPDCKGDPPTPLSPYGLLAVRPQVTSDVDPFAPAPPGGQQTSIQSVYGTNFGWWTYDNGCEAGSGILPSLGTEIATLIGFEIPGLAPNWGQALMSAVVNPTWTVKLDAVVVAASQSTTAGVWYPWLAVSLLLVAVVTMFRAVRGALPAAVTGVVWALLVLVVVSWTVSYPKESVDLLDSGIQTAVVSTASGFSDGSLPAGLTTAEQAQRELDHEWDQMVRSTLYRSWLQGAFGSADSATAKTYGASLFTATHFSWSEYDTYQADPNGKGKALIEQKANAFRQIAGQVQASDSVAYESFTGNNYWDRVGIGFLSFVEVAVVAWFLLVAAVVILLAYLLIRLVIPVAPAAGVFFMIEPLRAMALGWLRRVAGLLVMGPLFFLAALIVGRFNSAVMGSDLNMLLKLVLVGAVAVLAWRLLRPQSLAGRLRIPGLAALGAYMGSKAAWPHRDRSEAEDDAERSRKSEGSVSGDGPVYVGSSVAPTPQPVFAREAAEPIVFTATTASRPGTFAPRTPAALTQQADDDDGLLVPALPGSSPPSGAWTLRSSRQVAAIAAGPAAQLPPGSSGLVQTPDRYAPIPLPTPAIHVANVTYDQDGAAVFEIYTPDDGEQDESGESGDRGRATGVTYAS